MQIKASKNPTVLMHDGTEINRNGAAPGSALANYIRSRESGVAALLRLSILWTKLHLRRC